jgi:hypothetical protein
VGGKWGTVTDAPRCVDHLWSVNISVDYTRQSLTVTPEYDYAVRKHEREAFAIERKAENDELRKVWRAQVQTSRRGRA